MDGLAEIRRRQAEADTGREAKEVEAETRLAAVTAKLIQAQEILVAIQAELAALRRVLAD